MPLIYVTLSHVVFDKKPCEKWKRFLNFWYKAQYFNSSLGSNLILGGPCGNFCKAYLAKGSVGQRTFSSREESRLAKNELLEIYFIRTLPFEFPILLRYFLELKPKTHKIKGIFSQGLVIFVTAPL